MTAQPKSVIKSYFETGDKPTQAQFVDLIDSYQDTGAGGSVTGPASSVDSQIALFSGTGGTVLKAATVTGVLKAASGVITTASSGTDFAPATSGSSFLKGNSSGGFTNQASINLTDLATQGANTVLAEATGSTASPTAVALSTQQVLGRLGGNITGVTVGTGANNLVQLDGSSKLPAVDGSALTNIPSSFVFLGSQTASASASLPFTSKITASYDNYLFIIKDIVLTTASQSLVMQLSLDNSTYDTGNHYNSGATDITNITTPAAGTSNFVTQDKGVILGAAINDSTSGINGAVTLYNPNSTTTEKVISGTVSYKNASSNILSMNICGCRAFNGATTPLAAIQAVRFLSYSGNITSGVIYMYGIKNT